MKTKPQSADDVTGDFEKFKDFARQILSVPHSEIKAQLDAEKAAKRTFKLRFPRLWLSRAKRQPRTFARFSHLAGQFCVGQSFP